MNLMLDEGLVERLRREAREHHMSMSEMARTLLDRELSHAREPAEVLERLRQLRESFGRMPDSAETVRKGRDQAQREEALQKLDTLAEEIARSWRSPKTALELIEDQRR
ncbi:MAG TPA: hypothetical protein VFJ65_09155 [Solirubrobacterales bacterium]|nr:hypothetical protein [Solirubrobacterales bacterium]